MTRLASDKTAAQPSNQRPWMAACVWLAIVGPLFFATYSFANWFTAQRAFVPSVVFEWERHIPFVPWTIIPYWSIDVLYVVSIFLCRSRAELRMHALRLLVITLLSVVCFLLFPLRFSFAHPETSGVFGMLFDALTSFDRPFNQAPSLHIGLLWIITLRFAAHTPSRWRWVCYAWMALIAVSVLTTWQHHAIDVITGFVAGVIVAYALPSETHAWRRWPRDAQTRSTRIGAYYLVGAIAATCPLVIWGGTWWTWLLLWPSVSCLLTAAGYFKLGPSIFQKSRAGVISPSAAVVMIPVRLGLWISMCIHTKSLKPISNVSDVLAIGCYPKNESELSKANIGAVLDLTAEFSRPSLSNSIGYLALPRLDLLPPTLSEIRESIAAVEALRKVLPERNRILVHCALGLSRSATIAAAWLVYCSHDHTISALNHAIGQIRATRPEIILQSCHMQILEHWIQCPDARPHRRARNETVT